MGQQNCCKGANRVPRLEEDLCIGNLQILGEVNHMREEHKEELKKAKITCQGEAIFRGNLNKLKQKQGYGQYYMGQTAYFGMFDEDKPNGHGIAIIDDTTYYSGQFQDGVFHGPGKQYGPHFYFEGDFEQGQRKKGIFRNDQFEYHGQFQNNTLHGQGLIIFHNHVRYQGKFQNGKMHGRGVILFPNGKIFRGSLEMDTCGEGEFDWVNKPKPNRPSRLYIYIYEQEQKKEVTSHTGKSMVTPSSGTKELHTPRSMEVDSLQKCF